MNCYPYKNILVFIFIFICTFQGFSEQPICRSCNQFLQKQSERVAEMTSYAKKQDKYWQQNAIFFGVILPEFVTQTEFEQVREKALFSTVSFFSSETCEAISIGPFQMQPAFIESVVLSFPQFYVNSIANHDQIKKGGVRFIISNYSSFKSLDVQLVILKYFINRCYAENRSLSSLSPQKAMSLISMKYNSGTYQRKNIMFKKIDCEKRHYSDWAEYLPGFYKI